MTRGSLEDIIREKLKGLVTYLNDEDYENAIQEAVYETGWSFPLTDDFKIFWFDQRVRRHLFYYLLTGQASKFKFEQIHLNQRFEHYKILVDKADEDFKEAQANNPALFVGAEAYKSFGDKFSAGFRYNKYGKDITYNE